MDTISVVVPCYNEAEAIPIFYQEMQKLQTKRQDVRMELLFVDDGSVDESISIIQNLAEKNENVQYISLSRNFGKEGAMYAGLSKASGAYVAIMDVDLQDPPRLLEQMYDILQEGEYDCVATRRKDRQGEPPIRSFFAQQFYRLINKISDTEIVNGARDFRMMTRKMTDAVLSMSEVNRFSKGIFSWVGFQTKWLEYPNVQRSAGQTKWSFWKLFCYSIEGITGFSVTPLYLSFVFGLVCLLAGLGGLTVVVVKCLITKTALMGVPLLLCVLLLLGGMQFLCIGILGQYLAKTYLESKHRPSYIIRQQSVRDRASGRKADEKKQKGKDRIVAMDKSFDKRYWKKSM